MQQGAAGWQGKMLRCLPLQQPVKMICAAVHKYAVFAVDGRAIVAEDGVLHMHAYLQHHARLSLVVSNSCGTQDGRYSATPSVLASMLVALGAGQRRTPFMMSCLPCTGHKLARAVQRSASSEHPGRGLRLNWLLDKPAMTSRMSVLPSYDRLGGMYNHFFFCMYIITHMAGFTNTASSCLACQLVPCHIAPPAAQWMITVLGVEHLQALGDIHMREDFGCYNV